MRLLIGLILSALALVSCKFKDGVTEADLQDNDTMSGEASYKEALRQAASEASTLLPEAQPAVDLPVLIGHDQTGFATFQKLRRGHRLLFFVKQSSISADDRRGSEAEATAPIKAMQPFYSSPVEYDFNATLLVTCHNFIREQGFADLIKDFFRTLPAGDDPRSLYCAALKFTPVDDRRVNRSKGDVAQVNLYVDSRYRPHGLDLDRYTDKSNRKRISHPLDFQANVTSKLDFVPYDLPNLAQLSRQVGVAPPNGATVTSADKLALPADQYVGNALRKRRAQLCDGQKITQITYRERFGVGTQRVSWCAGDAWPTVIENDRFLSVLIRKPN